MPHLRLRPLPRKSKPTANSPAETSNPSRTLSGIDSKEVLEREEYDGYNDDAEDIFSAFLPHLLPDDAPQFHGDPGQLLQYRSPLYGDLTIMVPQYPEKSGSWNGKSVVAGDHDNIVVNEVEEGRKLFAHMLWSSAMVVAERLEDAATMTAESSDDLDRASWSVQGHTVLELGAGSFYFYFIFVSDDS